MQQKKSWLDSRVMTVVLIALIAVFAVHVLAWNTESVRLDLTADNLYSLSGGTREILDRMHAEGVKPIELKLYFSATAGKSLPKFIKDFITYEKFMEALLEEYAVASKGKIEVEFIDPVPDSDEAQDALDYGLDGKQINQDGDLFFFGLAFETQTGSRDVIDFLWPNKQETVEYEISKRIHKLIWPERQKIGVLAGLEVVSDASNPFMRQVLQAQGRDPGESWVAFQVLGEQYDVSRIDPDTDHISPEDYDLVIVVHPKNVGDRALWALDEWVSRGGSTLVFLDPYALNDQPPPSPQQQPWMQLQYKPSSNLERLLAKWGIERQEDKVAADFNLAVVRPVAMRGPSERVLVDLLIDEQVRDQTLDTGHPILQGINDLRFFLAGSLVETKGEGGEDGEENADAAADGIERLPLIRTTPEGNAIEIVPGFPDGEQLVFADLNTPGKVADHYTPGEGGEGITLAYLVHGKLPPLFPAGASVPSETPAPPPGLPPGIQLPPPPNAEMIHKDPVPEAERAEATVVVFADVDMIADQIAFQRTPFGALAANDNYKVLLNAVDYLFGSEELMKVRSKAKIDRPFTLFDEIEAAADRETLERERQLRADVERFEEQLREKQASIGEKNAALFEKQLQDEVDQLNEQIRAKNAELREIRKAKRAALEGEEARVRFAVMGFTPTLVLILGLFLFFRRRMRDIEARRSMP